MSTNGQLVFTDVDKITFKGVGNASNAVIDTLTGKIGVGVDSPEANLHVLGNSYVSTNLELGGTLIMGTVNVESQHSLEAVTATGNITPLTLEFTNPTTSLVASGNVEVGGDVVLSGNIYNNANLSVQYTTIFPTWTQVGSDIDGEAASDYSGWSVSMSSDGTRMAIGAIYNDGTASNAGHVRVYYWNSGTSQWTQVGQDIDGEAAGDRFGRSVSMSSDGARVAIGAYGNDGNGSDAGHVRVYSESGGTWTQVGQDIDGEAADDNSGYSVSMSSDGTRVAIGAYGNDGNGGNGSDAGHVRVYDWNGSQWSKVGSDIDGEAAGDESGTSVSMSSDGTRVAIGADGNDGTGNNAGHVRVYAESGGTWTQVGTDIDGEAAGDYSRWSVSMSSDGTRVAIGAYTNDGTASTAGHVRVYAESGGTWTQVGSDIDGEAAGDESGYSVSMSSDGTRVAIGAVKNDGTGNDAGHVRVYAESGGTWTQVGSDIDSEAAGDRFGHSVSMSSDGTRVAIGAPTNAPVGALAGAGHVRVFDCPLITGSKKILKENIVEVGGELTVSGNATVSSNLTVSGFVGSSGTGALTVPVGTTAQQPTGVAGMIRFNSTLNKLEVYNGTAWQGLGGISATGGTVTTSGGYKIHTFTGVSDIFTVIVGGEVEYLVVAGGGGGGTGNGGGGMGGGGAGGLLTGTVTVGPGNYTVTVGDGGARGIAGAYSSATNGTDSTISFPTQVIADGGGKGATSSGPGTAPGGSGGSGGGGGGNNGAGGLGGTGTSGPPRQGYNGGRGGNGTSGLVYKGGGGGGAGASGKSYTNSNSVSLGLNGGIGIQSSINGNATYYAGGGGGGGIVSGWANTIYGGTGGLGGGGDGGDAPTTQNGTTGDAGTENTGGGGGGGAYQRSGGGGGSGIVIIRYLQ